MLQYIFDITEEEDELMVSLEQQDKRVDKNKDNFTIGFTILKVCFLNSYSNTLFLKQIFCMTFRLLETITRNKA